MEDARSERTALQEALNVNDYTSLAESADNQSLDEELEELEAFLCEELYEQYVVYADNHRTPSSMAE